MYFFRPPGLSGHHQTEAIRSTHRSDRQPQRDNVLCREPRPLRSQRTLRELEKYYPQIDHAVVLAYLPHARDDHIGSYDTMFPEGLESVHPRYAISRRNDWMLRHSDYVITYFTHTWGGAYQYAQKARRQSKNVIDIR